MNTKELDCRWATCRLRWNAAVEMNIYTKYYRDDPISIKVVNAFIPPELITHESAVINEKPMPPPLPIKVLASASFPQVCLAPETLAKAP